MVGACDRATHLVERFKNRLGGRVEENTKRKTVMVVAN